VRPEHVTPKEEPHLPSSTNEIVTRVSMAPDAFTLPDDEPRLIGGRA
jgi:hypothetical protein